MGRWTFLIKLPSVIHDRERANLLYQHVELQRKAVESLKAALRDEGMIRMLRTPAHWLEDVEHYFLGSLEKEERIKEQEAAWLFEAEKLLQLAINERMRLEGLIEKHGGPESVKVIG